MFESIATSVNWVHLLVVGVLWTLTGQLAAAMLTLSLVAIVGLAMLAALNRTNETRST